MKQGKQQDNKKQQPKGGIKPKKDELTDKELEKASGGRSIKYK